MMDTSKIVTIEYVHGKSVWDIKKEEDAKERKFYIMQRVKVNGKSTAKHINLETLEITTKKHATAFDSYEDANNKCIELYKQTSGISFTIKALK